MTSYETQLVQEVVSLAKRIWSPEITNKFTITIDNYSITVHQTHINNETFYKVKLKHKEAENHIIRR